MRYDTMFLTLFLCVLHYSRVQCHIEDSVIWDKSRENFVELYNVSRFYDLRGEGLFARTGPKEEDINGKLVKASYYEEQDIVMFYENDTKVTGICGEIWNLLAFHLNFTLIPIKQRERNFGVSLENGSYSGLMGLIHRKETQVILRMGYYSLRDNLFDYTTPVWNTRYRLYIQPTYVFDNQWIITMFTRQTWMVIISLFAVLTVVGYVLQHKQYENKKQRKKLGTIYEYYNFKDHCFYTYSIMCGQGYLPGAFHRQNKILSLSKTIFAWFVLLAFSSNLIYRMANRTMMPPFTNIDTMINKSKYDLLVFKGSVIYEFIKDGIQHAVLNKNYAVSRRVHFVEEPKMMYEQLCNLERSVAILETQDKAASRSKGFCSIIPIGEGYFHSWIGFGVAKRFPYKRIIDVSIIKLHEAGLIDLLKKRWLTHKATKERNPFKTIDMDQVHLIFFILVAGAIVSLIIFTLENIVFLYNRMRR